MEVGANRCELNATAGAQVQVELTPGVGELTTIWVATAGAVSRRRT